MKSDFVNDYYTNNICWSGGNILAVATEDKAVNLWNATLGSVCELKQESDITTSVSWNKDGSILVIGFNSGQIHLWDIERTIKIGQISGHRDRVPVISWNPVQKHLISSGSDNFGNIMTHDIRSGEVISSVAGNCAKICGLEWSPNGQQLASSGSDNEIQIWKVNVEQPEFRLQKHNSTVKALSWSHNYQSPKLASGGGVGDGKICIWETETGKLIRKIKHLNSRVFGLVWSKVYSNLLIGSAMSKNNAAENNAVRVFDITKEEELLVSDEITDNRILNIVESPRGGFVAGAYDNTLSFWKVTKDGLTQQSSIKHNSC